MLDVEQKLAIHELMHRAAYGLDTGNLDMLGECFAPDASMLIRIAGQDPVGPFEGHEAIMGLMKGAIDSQVDVRRHVISNLFFESESDTSATVISNLTLFASKDGVLNALTAGIYRDVVTKSDKGWVLVSRHLDLDLPF